jgi:hypothetical protein
MRVTKVDAGTLRIQPGQRLADNGATWVSIADAYYLDVTFSDIDTGAEAASTWYSLWVYYVGSTVTAVLSTSATAPTGVTAAKYFVGWFYNDSASAFSDIATMVLGTQLQVLFEPLPNAAGLLGLQAITSDGVVLPTGSWQEITGALGTNSLGSAAWPPDRVRALAVYARVRDDFVVQIGGFGAHAGLYIGASGNSGDRTEGQCWVASNGSLYFHLSADGNVEYIRITGYLIDRSGATEDGTGL